MYSGIYCLSLVHIYSVFNHRNNKVAKWMITVHNSCIGFSEKDTRTIKWSFYLRKILISISVFVIYGVLPIRWDLISISNPIWKSSILSFKGSSGSHGYCLIHQMCIKNNLVISMETVRLILQILDPEGVSGRRRRRLRRRQYIYRGPIYMWHMDGYDKLEPYGIAIHHCTWLYRWIL